MKSKINKNLTIFLCALILTFALVLSSNLKSSIESTTNAVTNEMLEDSDLTRRDLGTYWKELFSGSREGSCKKAVGKKVALAKIEQEKKKNVKGRSAEETKLPWVRRWGYGDAAYFFDFLDPVFQKYIIDAFDESYETLKSIDNKDTDYYQDVFDIEKLIKSNPKSKNTTINSEADFKKINKNYNKIVYDNSINTVQLNKAMKDWGWFIPPGLKDYAYDIVSKYDVDGDGRLNPREMMLANIHSNQDVVRYGKCMYCLADVARRLDAMFIFLDCENKGAISVEDLWKKLPKLVRPDNRWNIYGIDTIENIRTAALNDFCLKNGIAKQGYITKKEFRTGVMLGYWDRQTSIKEIVKDDSRNLKNLRWDERGMKDRVAYRVYMENLKAKEMRKKKKH